jgi:hypothetical protein
MQETSTETQKDATADGAVGPLAERGQRFMTFCDMEVRHRKR